MTDPDQCIICLESLEPAAEDVGVADSEMAGDPSPSKEAPGFSPPDENTFIATLVGCNHVIHDRCIRSWANNSNTCPICRATFNEVKLSTKIDGPIVDSYPVQDKIQTQEFDLSEWLQENPDESEEETPCPICGTAERPDILLLCDACDAAYHTHCIGLDHVPSGSWYCLECADLIDPQLSPDNTSDWETQVTSGRSRGRSSGRPFTRTRERQRRARRQARSVEWQGAWGRIAGRVFDATNIDLDNHEDDDSFEGFRRSLQQRERELREYQQWERRLAIASRQGARETFAMGIPRAIGERLDIAQPVEQETPEEQKAWNELDRIRETENPGAQNRRKRKSATSSPREPASEEPQRKLKRPRTRRLVLHGEASGSGISGSGAASASATSSTSTVPPVPQAQRSAEEPSFLSSLLREVETGPPSDDENGRTYFSSGYGVEASSPAASPGASSHNSPRNLSLTPPPLPRPTSPSTLSSHIEPVFPKANYSPARSAGETSDSDNPPRSMALEIRHPRPRRPDRRQGSPRQARSQDSSPTRQDITLRAKEKINGIVLAALKPHWRAKKLTVDQYSNINRDVSRKLYDSIRDASALDDDAGKKNWEKVAAEEVAQAISGLKA
ncbi:hypothetical protein SODALDRAFT_356495 [Sodiomyces alkalinus F11]|uniref:PHD and RING finger domain-containing protein n=1 Tax=Sodiomyces alkalinus (strain CBS 110278 / VKM F-3762 / F11) TaxID=1314773 RepID=A0A3N2Q163_SODAK|nr:hypothetical protein SODALDRAFT_356495 [Sodiomyces alkalinus F11]ROT40499.1 hypothetical protein SODALDRAFT_356495 [Sodiomyces alkalinus F11]